MLNCELLQRLGKFTLLRGASAVEMMMSFMVVSCGCCIRMSLGISPKPSLVWL